MARDHVKLEIVNENNKESDTRVDKEIERVFGKPPVLKPSNNTVLNTTTDRTKLLNGGSTVEDSEAERTTQPLLEPRHEKQLPPLSGPEIDDLDENPPKDATPYPGIDDGLLEPSDKKPDATDLNEEGHDTEHGSGDEHHTFRASNDGGIETDGKLPWDHDEPDYPYGDWNTKPISLSTHNLDHDVTTVRSYASYANGFDPRFGTDDRAISPIPGIAPDVNTYQQKKNLAQGMMDLALLSANANQLRYVLELSSSHPYYYSSVTFISLSIIFQILVGVGLILNSRYDVKLHKDICKADKINNMTVIGIFLVTILNVFITSFGVATAPPTNVSVLPRSGALMDNSSITTM